MRGTCCRGHVMDQANTYRGQCKTCRLARARAEAALRKPTREDLELRAALRRVGRRLSQVEQG